MRNKNALSAVIETILLILISITAIAIISGVVIPFIIGQMENTKCLETAGKVTINSEYGYACYYSSGSNRNVKITISRGDVQIEGIKIKIGSNARSKTFEIENLEVEELNGVTMLGGGNIVLPGVGEDVTYVLNVASLEGVATYAEIYPISNEKMCDRTDDITLEGCGVI